MAQSRLLSLDVLRGVAIFLVLFRHLPVLPEFAELQGFIRSTLLVLRRGGWMGVDLFFVLSGFLVSGLIFKEYQRTQAFRPFHFLIRRGFKIYPAFYFCAALTYLWIYTKYGGHVVPWQGIVGELFFLQNYLGGFILVTWSLAIEEHFYITLAVLLYLLSRRGGENPFRAIPVIFVFVAVLVLAIRIGTFSSQNYSYADHLMPTHKRADALFYGVFLSYLYHYYTAPLEAFYRRMKWVLIPAAILMLVYAFCRDLEGNAFIHTIGFSLHSLAFSILLLATLHGPDVTRYPRVFSLALRAIAFVGVYSYSIYLWHETLFKMLWTKPVIASISQVTGPVAAFYVALVVLAVCAIAGGILAAFIVEVPFLKLRERWFPVTPKPSENTVKN